MINADYIEIEKHKTKYFNHNMLYSVASFLKEDHLSFDKIERPIVIFKNGNPIYMDEIYKKLSHADKQQFIENCVDDGLKLVYLGYTEKEVELFSEKYFTVLI